MTEATAKKVTAVIGWMILVGSVTQTPMFARVVTILFSTGAWAMVLDMVEEIVLAFALATAAGVGLVRGKSLGFFFIYVSTLASIFGAKPTLIPLIQKALPPGPEIEFYLLAINSSISLILAWCHWSIAREQAPSARRSEMRVIAGFLILWFPLLAYWKTGIRTGNGEVQKISDTPLIGRHVSVLESTQPILYRSHEMLRRGMGTVIFRGVSAEANIRAFAETNGLRLMTNQSARAQMLPYTRFWKLNSERFPVFTNSTDLCYIGRIPKGSTCSFQICHRPSDGRFTAMAFGNPNEARKVELPLN